MCGHVLLLLLLAVLAPLAAAYTWQHCGGTGNYTANSTYQANLNVLAAGLPKNASSSPTLFATGTAGAVPDQAYALTLCRGDTNASECLACATQAFPDAQQLCLYDRDATVYYDTCILRFSNQNFLASTANSHEEAHRNTQNVTSDSDRFQRLVYKLLNATADYAASNSTRRFATGEVDFNASYPKIYALTQCTPDLTPTQCRSCLAGQIVLERQLFPWNPLGARVLGERCNLRFELYSFYAGGSILQLPAEAATPAAIEGKKRNVATLVLAIAMPLVAAILAMAVTYLWFRRRPTRKPAVPYTTDREDVESLEALIVDLSTLRVATNNFAESNKLGEGGFGAVYKGALPDGQEIAVKRLSQSSGQGMGELKNELVLVAKLQHKNLVRLVGVCLEEHEKLLVYEYMPNKSLDTILFGTNFLNYIFVGKDGGELYKIATHYVQHNNSDTFWLNFR